MNTLKSISIIISFSVALLLGSCGSNSSSDHESKNHEAIEEGIIDMGHPHEKNDGGNYEKKEEDDMHEQHQSLKDEFAHQDILLLEEPYLLEDSKKKELVAVIESYLELKYAFYESNLTKIDRLTTQMKEKVEQVDKQSLAAEGKKAWQQHDSLYTKKLSEMLHLTELIEKQSYFSHISEIVYCTVKSFDLKINKRLYAIYCPMAFDGIGAYWISDSKEINNPYLGEKMPKCGEIKEEL
mgnify:CR=1 FL=1|jgi:uncharacterized protein DUF3347